MAIFYLQILKQLIISHFFSLFFSSNVKFKEKYI